jgi:hypothetical protein
VRKRALIVAAAVIVVAIGAALLWPGEREPEYQGKKLSEWVILCAKRNTGELTVQEIDAAPIAIRQIGTNGVPHLVRWIEFEPRPRGEPNRIERTWLRIRDKLKIGGGGAWHKSRKDVLEEGAMIAFEILGPEANAAVSRLCPLLNQNTADYNCSWNAYRALTYIGSESVPYLTDALKYPKHLNRTLVAQLLGEKSMVGKNSDAAVAALSSCLHDADGHVVVAAAGSLRAHGADMTMAVLPLIKAGKNADWSVASPALQLLRTIAPEALQTNNFSGVRKL